MQALSGVPDKGVFLLSLDTELAWGGVHNGSYVGRRLMYDGTRAAISRLLALVEEYEISATWALVGHLLLHGCSSVNGQKHPELVRPNYTWFKGDWFDCDPCTDVVQDPYWYGPDIVELLLNCRVPQEIGCHSFSHVIVGDPGCGRECFDSELKACIAAAKEWDLTLKSFVYPRNEIAHLDILAANGFSCYRGNLAPSWHARVPVRLGKLARGMQWALPVSPLTGKPEFIDGLWNLASSTYYLHRDGVARRLPITLRVRRAEAGIEEACRQRSLFHLYFHPFNLATDPDGLLAGLETIFRYVAEKRCQGELLNLTMGDMAEGLSLATLQEVMG